jgi:Bacterial Ig domain
VDPAGFSPCTTLATGTASRTVDLRDQRCDGTVGKASWSSVSLADTDPAGGELSSATVSISDAATGEALGTHELMGGTGTVDLASIDPARHPALAISAAARSVAGDPAWSDGVPPKIRVAWHPDPKLVCFHTTTVVDCAQPASTPIGISASVTGTATTSDAGLTVLRSASRQQTNHPPTATAQSVTTPEDTPVGITLAGTDQDGDSLSYRIVSPPSHGTLSGTAPNITYAPAPGYTGPDSFTFTVNDGQLDVPTAVVSITVTPSGTACAKAAPTVDAVLSADIRSPASRFTTPKLTTANSGDLILLFVEADGPTAPTQKVTGVTGASLAWTLAARSNATWGTTEVWQAYAAGPVTSTAQLAKAYDGSVTVAALHGSASHVGAVATTSGLQGAPTAVLTPTSCGSLLWAAGDDWSHATAPVPVSGQSLVHQFLDTHVHDSFWVQRVDTPTLDTTPVTIKATGPVKDRWTMAAVEIPPHG